MTTRTTQKVRRRSERGAVYIFSAAVLALLFFMGAGISSLVYSRYEARTFHDLAGVVAIGAVYHYHASGSTGGAPLSYAQSVAQHLLEKNIQELRLGRFSADGAKIDSVIISTGRWDFANAPNCNAGGTEPGGCYDDLPDPGAENALRVSFVGETGTEGIFGKTFLPGRFSRTYSAIAAYSPALGPVIVKR